MSKVRTTERCQVSGPLCRRYLLVLLVDVPLTALDDERIQESVVRWGIGVLQNGEHELLGAWHEADLMAAVWPAIFDDLKARGVESIRFVVGADPASIEAAVREPYPGVTVLPALADTLLLTECSLSFGQQSVRLLSALGPRHRRIVRKAIEAANQASRRLNLAVARHGCFPSPIGAASFVFDTITRAERRAVAGAARLAASTLYAAGSKASGVRHSSGRDS